MILCGSLLSVSTLSADFTLIIFNIPFSRNESLDLPSNLFILALDVFQSCSRLSPDLFLYHSDVPVGGKCV